MQASPASLIYENSRNDLSVRVEFVMPAVLLFLAGVSDTM